MAKRCLHTIAKEEAIKRIVESVRPFPGDERVPAPLARGRITAGPVEAVVSNSPFTCSAMDGFAANFEAMPTADLDSPVSFQKPSQAFSVNTGDPSPPWIGAVIMVGDIEDSPSANVIRKPAFSGSMFAWSVPGEPTLFGLIQEKPVVFSLDFMSLAEEEYDLLVTKAFMADQRFDILMKVTNSKEFSERLNMFGGYNTADTGKTKYAT